MDIFVVDFNYLWGLICFKMSNYMTHNVAKGVRNLNNGNVMTWWKTNFNMPVPYLFDWSGNQEGGPLSYYGKATSFDLSGFNPGWELVGFFCIWHWDGPISGAAYLSSKWRDRYGSTMFYCANSAYLYLNVASGYWSEYMYGCNQGVAGWEIDSSGNYSVQSWSTGAGSISTKTTTITFSNVPSTSSSGGESGHIWIEGNDLCYIDAINNDSSTWKQTMVGVKGSYKDVAKAGALWIGTNNYLHWIGNDGYEYLAEWRIQQYASTWSNGPTNEQHPGTSYKGYMWVDNEFGQTHLAYIGYNGYKFLAGSGQYPYWAPY